MVPLFSYRFTINHSIHLCQRLKGAEILKKLEIPAKLERFPVYSPQASWEQPLHRYARFCLIMQPDVPRSSQGSLRWFFPAQQWGDSCCPSWNRRSWSRWRGWSSWRRGAECSSPQVCPGPAKVQALPQHPDDSALQEEEHPGSRGLEEQNHEREEEIKYRSSTGLKFKKENSTPALILFWVQLVKWVGREN